MVRQDQPTIYIDTTDIPGSVKGHVTLIPFHSYFPDGKGTFNYQCNKEIEEVYWDSGSVK